MESWSKERKKWPELVGTEMSRATMTTNASSTLVGSKEKMDTPEKLEILSLFPHKEVMKLRTTAAAGSKSSDRNHLLTPHQ
jgi:hypothetical protein